MDCYSTSIETFVGWRTVNKWLIQLLLLVLAKQSFNSSTFEICHDIQNVLDGQRRVYVLGTQNANSGTLRVPGAATCELRTILAA